MKYLVPKNPDPVERCKHVKSRDTTGVFQARQAKASIYICTTDVGNNRSRDGRGGKHGRNRCCATTIPTFYPSRIPDPGVKKAPDPGSTILERLTL
jgi:hypothetical protein